VPAPRTPPNQPPDRPSLPGVRLDETDRRVLELLGRDGRASYAEIGLLVNLSALRQFPEVVAAWTVTGDPDALVHLRAADTRHLESVIERIRKERGVQRSRSSVVLSQLIGG